MRVFASLIRGFEKLIVSLACFQSCIWTSCFTCSAGNRPLKHGGQSQTRDINEAYICCNICSYQLIVAVCGHTRLLSVIHGCYRSHSLLLIMDAKRSSFTGVVSCVCISLGEFRDSHTHIPAYTHLSGVWCGGFCFWETVYL